MSRVAVFDLGKTNARVLLCDTTTGAEIAIRRRRNAILPGPPFPHHDVAAQEAFLLDALRDFAAMGPLDAVLPVAHGATIALTDGAELVFPLLDYEHDGPDATAPDYEALRPPFAVTGTPRMGQGLNLGAQLFWLRDRWPEAFARVRQALFWPQYWSWRLSGVMAAELAYASGHGDLWDLATRQAVAEGGMGDLIRGLFPPLRRAGDMLGPLRPDFGLPGVQVLNGAHDSSLALLPYAGAGHCTVLSTGTWLTAFALGGAPMPREAEAVMASLDIEGRLVPNFRFMGGRIFDDLRQPRPGLPTLPPAALTLKGGQLVSRAKGTPAEVDPALDRASALGAVLAQVTLEGLGRIGAQGPIHFTGPFAGNPGFVATLRAAWPAALHLHDYEKSIAAQVAELLAAPLDRGQT